MVSAQAVKFRGDGCLKPFVLARLLTPRDYGLVGMVVVVTGFVSAVFKNLGLSTVMIQRPELTHETSEARSSG
jgi:O-antigen/teichoic acid export membrane protein